MSEAERPDAATGRRAPRWMWVVLVISVGLNLLVAGVVASAAWHFHNRDGFRGRLSAYLETLPPQRAEVLRGIRERFQPTLRPLRQQIRDTRQEAAQLFAADPLDRQTLVATHKRLMDAEVRIRQVYTQLMTELAESMTADERRAFMEWRAQRRRGLRRSANVASDQAQR